VNAIPDAQAVRRELARHAPHLADHARERLVQLYSEPLLPSTLGPEPVAIDPKVRISIAEGAALARLVRENGVRSSIEIGLAYGFSTVWLLEALSGQEGARHIAIDPFEEIEWAGIGLKQAELMESGVDFRWIGESSALALPALIREGVQADFVFIDSRHVFDETLVEFFLADKLLRVGGLLALDDQWMPSMQAVTNYILADRAYTRVPHPVRNLCVLRKLGEDERSWDHFRPFRTSSRHPLDMARRVKRRWLTRRG